MGSMIFVIPAIKGKGRPRMTKTGHVYTPKETAQFENLVKLCYQQAGGEMHDGPVSVIIKAHFQRPLSHYKGNKRDPWLKPKAPHWHTGKPDVDNIAKAICDSLNKQAWRDDSCVALISVSKVYSTINNCCVVTIKDMDPESEE